MKQITNWRKATVADIEADGLLDEATEIHVLGYNMLGTSGKTGSLRGRTESERIKKFFQHHIDTKTPVVLHNGIGYDIPLVEKVLGMDLTDLMVVDTLSVSWYLNTERNLHGLDSFFGDYGIAKHKVGNHRWAAPIKEKWNTDKGHETRLKRHYAIMNHRVTQDVRINVALWEDLKERLTDIYSNVKRCVDAGLVDGKRVSEGEVCYIDQYKHSSSVDEYIDRILTFLMFKADCARLKEKTKFKVDVGKLDNLIASLSEKIEEARVELEGVMPPVPQYTKKSRPAKGYKMNGERTAHGLSWDAEVAKIGFADEHGNPLVKQVDLDNLLILKGYEPPNINGHQQIKDFLFSKGWKPRSFKFIKDEVAQQKWADSGFKPHLKPKPRAVPQVSVDGDGGKELCPSVVELAETVPEIMSYAKYTTIKHRLDMCKGFKRDLRPGGYLCARVGGYTNCMVADTLILTDAGMKRIVDVTKSLKVLTHEGRYRQVTDLINNGIKPVIRVKLRSGKEITCTHNHKLYALGGLWVEVAKLKVGQEVFGYGDAEEWREIKDFSGFYVSNWGRVMSNTGSLYTINRRNSKDIRSNVTLPITGKRGKDFLVSRLVLSAFVGESPLHALHKDGNPNNNNLKNLYYGTDADNWADTKVHGTHLAAVRGKTNGKVSEEMLQEIRAASLEGQTGRGIAKRFGISSSYVSFIINGRRRTHKAENTYKEQFCIDYVESLEYLGEVPTFDISVEEDHSYVANGVVVHNTLREQHRELVNLPSVTKPYGADIRGLLCSTDDRYVLVGSDLSGLEDRVKHHFMLPYDRDYVETMLEEDYDAHLLTALSAGMITQKDFDNYKSGIKEAHVVSARKAGKATNYASVYGSGAETLSRTCGLPVSTCKTLIEGYWKLNWSVKAIAEDQCVIEASGGRWLINPINGFAYSLRGDKDRFSTLCQGTGSYFFDIWCNNIFNTMQTNWGKKTLTFTAHDENVFCVKDSPAVVSTVTGIVRDSLVKLNKDYNLRRELGCDVQLGKSYAEIH